MNRAHENLRQYLAETDPTSLWIDAYQDAKAHYDVIKWPAYIASLAICIGLIFVAGYFLVQVLQPDQIGVRFMGVLGVYDGIALRIVVWLTPWLPWPPWFREFGELHDTLKPFTRVLRRKRGEPEDDFA
jgi:hypothetical protein